MTATALPKTLSEAQFQRTVIDAAMVFGWQVHHSRPARTARGWATPITGHPGLPDLVLARDGVVLLVELKAHRGQLTPGQKRWAQHLGSHGRVWRPAQWPQILAELRDPCGGNTKDGDGCSCDPPFGASS